MTRSSGSAAPPGLSIRSGTPADTPAILELVRRSLGEGTIPREPAYWTWKHFENPFGPSPVLLAEEDGRIVGLRVFMRWQWAAGGSTVDAVRAVDTATHPHYQGRGIFKRLTLALVDRMASEGAAFVFNTPNAQSRPGYLKMGWSSLGRVPLLIRPVRPGRLLSFAASRSGRSPEPSVGAADPKLGLETAGDLLGRPELASLLARVAGGDRLRTPKSVEYLDWRYARIPGFAYYSVGRFADAEGAAVFCRLKPHGRLRELRLCDVFVGPGTRSRRLLRECIREAIRASDCDFVAAMAAPGSRPRGALLRAGFVPAPRTGPIFTVRPLNEAPLDPLQVASWDPSIGDLELF